MLLKNKIINIKSYYTIKKVFNNMTLKKKLELIKYNKVIQKRLNIGINNYKEYLTIEIEIEINPIKNTKFININKKEKKYYRIYFNGEENEIKRTYLNDEGKISKISVKIDCEVKSLRGLFCNCDCVKSISFKKFNGKNIINMSNMFGLCKSLKQINLLNFNSINVTDMSGMFN